MKATIKDNILIIEVEANVINPPTSTSGKSKLIASESAKTSVTIDGKQLTIYLNAYIKA